MKLPLTLGFIAAALVACDTRVNTSPPEKTVEKNTTIVNPPDKTVENKTTIINPPAAPKTEEKTKTTTTTETK